MEHTAGTGCRQLLECAGRAQRRRRFGSFPDGSGTLASYLPRLQNLKRRGASLPAALQKRWRAPPTALLQTLPFQNVRRLGVRPSSVAVLLRRVDRQSAAATALWIVPGRL